MRTLIRQAVQKFNRSGGLTAADISKLQAYANRHPFWRALASDETRATYDALVALAGR